MSDTQPLTEAELAEYFDLDASRSTITMDAKRNPAAREHHRRWRELRERFMASQTTATTATTKKGE